MKAWDKTLLSISLICYIAVSSVAAVHAFPKVLNGVASINVASSVSAMPEMMLNCHQQQNGDTLQSSVSSCKIFCAAMASAMPNDFVLYLPSNTLNSELAFFEEGLRSRPLATEPYPPR